MDGYLSTQRQTIFKNVAVLIYVFDTKSKDWDEDLRYFDQVLEGLAQMSGDDEDSAGEDSDVEQQAPVKKPGVYVLINKMDLEDPSDRARIERERASELLGRVKSRIGGRCMAFGTSIWDESLYKVRPLPFWDPSEDQPSAAGTDTPIYPRTGVVRHHSKSRAQRTPSDGPPFASEGEVARGRGRPVRASNLPRCRSICPPSCAESHQRPSPTAENERGRRLVLGR